MSTSLQEVVIDKGTSIILGAAQKKVPCGSWKCCGTVIGWKEVIFLGSGAYTVIMSVIEGIAENYLPMTGWIAPSVAIGLGYCYARKYDDLAPWDELAQKARAESEQFESELTKTKALYKGLKDEREAMDGQLERQAKTTAEIELATSHVKEQTAQFQKRCAELEHSEASLKKENAELRNKVEELSQLLKKFQEQVAQFKQGGQAFQAGLSQFDNGIGQLQQQSLKIESSNDKIVKELHDKIADLEMQIKTTKSANQEMIGQLQKQKACFDEEIDKLSVSCKAFERGAAVYEGQLKEAAAKEEAYQKNIATLEKRNVELEGLIQALKKENEAIAAQGNRLAGIEQEFEDDQAGLKKTEDGIANLMKELQDINKELTEK